MDALVEEAIELAEARSACTCEKCGALRSDTDIMGEIMIGWLRAAVRHH
ncbi:hypothetical protein [Bradyrhizobium sp.]|jgi:hypothetical protein